MAKMTTKAACELARALDDVSEKDHFGSDAFYANKKIFATVWHDKGEVNLRLNTDQQRRFLEEDGESFVEIDNAWGKQGWTRVQLQFADGSVFKEALRAAWSNTSITRARKKSVKSKATPSRSRPVRKKRRE